MKINPGLNKTPFPNRISLKSPAKLNLYLRILNKRKDGYHNIETVFEKIDLCDRLELRINRKGNINIFSSHPGCPSDKTNLCYKAARILKSKFKVPFGVDITIKKRIPTLSGLGGGSSNAAYTLWGLNKLWGLSLSQKRLIRYAKRLGSDVAFFLGQESFALGRGRGERLRYLRGIPPLWHVLVVPDIRLSTAKAYKLIEILRSKNLGRNSRFKQNLRHLSNSQHGSNTKMLTKTSYNVNILIRALRRKDLSLLSEGLYNDFGKYLIRVHPTLFKIQNQLGELGIRGIGFSGKGPSIFGFARSKKEALSLKRKLAKYYRGVFAVKTFCEG